MTGPLGTGSSGNRLIASRHVILRLGAADRLVAYVAGLEEIS
jgi:hypothetical protein